MALVPLRRRGSTPLAMPAQNKVARGILCAGLGGICWGFSGTCAQLLTVNMGIPVSWITCVRLLSAAVVYLIICLVRERRNFLAALRDKRSMARIVVFALLGVLLTQVSYLSAISYTNAGTGTVLERLGLVFIMLYVCIRMKRFPKLREVIGLIFAVAGTVLIATKGNLGSLSIPLEGLLWGLCAAFAFSCYTLLPGKILAKWGSFIVTGFAMLIGGSVSTVFVQPWNIPVSLSWELLIAMGSMVVIGTFAAYLFYLQGITDAGPVRAGLVGCIEPVSATVISALWLKTAVQPSDIIGCALILIMVVLVADRKGQKVDLSSSYDGATGSLPLFEGCASTLGYYQARRAVRTDLDDLRILLAHGHKSMEHLGIKEGMKKYPSLRRLVRALDAKIVYVVVADDPKSEKGSQTGQRCIGMFALDPHGDPLYDTIKGIQWLEKTPSSSKGSTTRAALHWVSVAPDARRCGVGRYILGSAERIARTGGCSSICADIYPSNTPMKTLLESAHYSFCGVVTLYNRHGRNKQRAIYERAW